jgi:hypothetical protein
MATYREEIQTAGISLTTMSGAHRDVSAGPEGSPQSIEQTAHHCAAGAESLLDIVLDASNLDSIVI